MNKLIDSAGFLTGYGVDKTKKIKEALEYLISHSELDKSELRVLGSCLSKMVGDIISNEINNPKPKYSINLFEMSDEQFTKFLKDKYGEEWNLTPLTDEELTRLPTISNEKVEEIFDKLKNRRPKLPPPMRRR